MPQDLGFYIKKAYLGLFVTIKQEVLTNTDILTACNTIGTFFLPHVIVPCGYFWLIDSFSLYVFRDSGSLHHVALPCLGP